MQKCKKPEIACLKAMRSAPEVTLSKASTQSGKEMPAASRQLVPPCKAILAVELYAF
jgi:hypothetical protein